MDWKDTRHLVKVDSCAFFVELDGSRELSYEYFEWCAWKEVY